MLLIDLEKPDLSIQTGHLKLGGKNPAGVEINANSRYLTLDGKPWLPVMGEFHYARVPVDDWEKELRKMKAGGIDIVAAYVFWIHHEEIEGQYEWGGNRNLRHLVEQCSKVGVYCYPRIGPWAHGECRNGGFPDWLLAKCGKDVRTDAPVYLSYVKRLYDAIAAQLHGLLWKDGGPIVGVQLENELIHNALHIRTLKMMAREAGIDVPLYTMTGWGPAAVPEDEVIPVFGGYPDAFWDLQATSWSRESRKSYFFSNLRDDNAIGKDLIKPQELGDISYMQRYPYGACETGSGMQAAYRRRPEVTADDVAALAYVKVGNGSNLLGYYMYHGGSNPMGKLTTMQESQATGYPNDLPVINYDFQAPLGEYGQARPSFHALRRLHLFINSFGSMLAPMPMVLPDEQPHGLDDDSTVRWSVRSDGKSSFLFINNYQRVESLPTHAEAQFQLNMADDIVRIPQVPTVIPSGTYCIWPVNMSLDGAVMKYGTVQPVTCVTAGNEKLFVFSASDGIIPEFAFEPASIKSMDPVLKSVSTLAGLRPGTNCAISIGLDDGHNVKMLVLTQTQSLQLYKLNIWGADHLILCSETVYVDGNTLHINTRQTGNVSFAIYPPRDGKLTVNDAQLVPQEDGIFMRYTIPIVQSSIAVNAQKVQEATQAPPIVSSVWGAVVPADSSFDGAEVWSVSIPEDALSGAGDIFLQVSYVGDIGRAYIGDKLIADDFFFGRTWEIGLRHFASELKGQSLTLKFLPLRKDAPVYIPPERRPDFGEQDQLVHVGLIHAVCEYDVGVSLEGTTAL